MAEKQANGFDPDDDQDDLFDDEPKAKAKAKVEEETDDIEIEVEDDVPEADRGKEPMPKEIVDELEADELEDYSDKVKLRMKQMKKVYHDERRRADAASREQAEAVAIAQRLVQENRKLKSTLSGGELQLLATYKAAAKLELDAAKRAYKEAYEAGDVDKVTEAQDAMTSANYRLQQANTYKPTLQVSEQDVESRERPAAQPPQQQKVDASTQAWQDRNEWWGTNTAMTGLAFGVHQELLEEHGQKFIGTKRYWDTIDNTMHQKFPEYFGGEVEVSANGSGKPAPKRPQIKPATVVAPASRSTSSKKVRLTPTQINLAAKLGLTPEQYAREALKLQAEN